MANARDIRRRIKSVRNTQKITQAMKMVAAAKVKRAENKVKASRPFSNELLKMFERLLVAKPNLNNSYSKTDKAIDNYIELLNVREVKKVGLLVITSDRGLAGAYNANVVRSAMSRIKELKDLNIDVKLFIVGTRGVNALKKSGIDINIINTYTRLPVIPTAGSSSVIAEDIAEAFVGNQIDKIEIITTTFKSMISYKIENWQILPVQIEPEIKKEDKEVHFEEMLMEPEPEALMQKIVPLYLSNRVYQALTEASASELAARMSAMSAASQNAEEMIQKLTTIYNKARQASITQEILEVVSGANALSG